MWFAPSTVLLRSSTPGARLDVFVEPLYNIPMGAARDRVAREDHVLRHGRLQNNVAPACHPSPWTAGLTKTQPSTSMSSIRPSTSSVLVCVRPGGRKRQVRQLHIPRVGEPQHVVVALSREAPYSSVTSPALPLSDSIRSLAARRRPRDVRNHRLADVGARSPP
jgi:hypothetical protein